MKLKQFIQRRDARAALAVAGLACATFAPAGAQTLDLNGANVSVDTLNSYTSVTNNGRIPAILTIGINGGSSTFAGTMADGFRTFGVIKVGSGVLTLTGVDTQMGDTGFNYPGGVLISSTIGPISMAVTGGTLAINSGAALGGGNLAISNAILASTGGGPVTINNRILIGLAPNATATFDTTGGDITVASAIVGYQPPKSPAPTDGGLIKIGSGALILAGANTYAGPTLVTQGALEVDGSIVSATSVFSGASLRGVGTVGAINVLSGGVLAPGNAAQPFGTLRATGNVAFAPGSIYSVAVSPAGSSLLTTSGSASLGGTVAAVWSGGAPGIGSRYTILSAAGGVTGTFAGLTVSGLNTLLPVLAYDSNDVYLAFNGLTRQAVQTSFQTQANGRFGGLVTYQVLASVLDGFNEQINCSNCVSAFGSVGSLSAGVHGRYAINDDLALLGGAAFAQYHSGEVDVTSSPLFLAALRYDKTEWGASRPFAEIGAVASPWQTVDYSRSYFDGLSMRQGRGSASAQSYEIFGKAGWVYRWSPIDEGSVYGGLSRVWQDAGGFVENGPNNSSPATILPGTDAINVARLGAQWTHLFVPKLETQINIALAQSFASQAGLSGSVLGYNNISTNFSEQAWAEYGVRLGYRVADGLVADIFADGTLGAQPVGDTIHGGVDLRYSF